MIKAIGTVLRALSAIWIAFALLRIIGGLTGIVRGNYVALGGGADLLVAVATFKFGTWLKTREKGGAVAERVQVAKSAWWRANYGFRLSVFLGVVWVIVCYFRQSDYDRDLGVVFWPPIGLLFAYFGYREFVVGSPTVAGEVEIPDTTNLPGRCPACSGQNVNLASRGTPVGIAPKFQPYCLDCKRFL